MLPIRTILSSFAQIITNQNSFNWYELTYKVSIKWYSKRSTYPHQKYGRNHANIVIGTWYLITFGLLICYFPPTEPNQDPGQNQPILFRIYIYAVNLLRFFIEHVLIITEHQINNVLITMLILTIPPIQKKIQYSYLVHFINWFQYFLCFLGSYIIYDMIL